MNDSSSLTFLYQVLKKNYDSLINKTQVQNAGVLSSVFGDSELRNDSSNLIVFTCIEVRKAGWAAFSAECF